MPVEDISLQSLATEHGLLNAPSTDQIPQPSDDRAVTIGLWPTAAGTAALQSAGGSD